MHLSVGHKSNRLPKRFPVGTTYVVEGSGGENGNLSVFSRYLVLPGGRRINLTDEFRGPASPRAHRNGRNHSQSRRKPGSGRAKKIMAG